MDADCFKALNDSAGHLRGDECLHRLARICERFAVDPHDVVARYGGEEFVLLLPGRSLEAAIAQGEALRLAVAQEAIAHPASPLAPHVTISVGVAALVPTDDASPQHLVAAADRAMYDAKTGGRDRVSWHRLPAIAVQRADERAASASEIR